MKKSVEHGLPKNASHSVLIVSKMVRLLECLWRWWYFFLNAKIISKIIFPSFKRWSIFRMHNFRKVFKSWGKVFFESKKFILGRLSNSVKLHDSIYLCKLTNLKVSRNRMVLFFGHGVVKICKTNNFIVLQKALLYVIT